MARTKGSLNKRTRAALYAVENGEFGRGDSPIKYLLRVMRDRKKPDELRVEAAKAVAPYLSPRLNSIDLNRPDPFEGATRADLLDQLRAAMLTNPGLMEQLGVAAIPPEAKH